MGRMVALLAIVLLVIGGLMMLLGRLTLPGDLVVRRGSLTIVFPLAASIVANSPVPTSTTPMARATYSPAGRETFGGDGRRHDRQRPKVRDPDDQQDHRQTSTAADAIQSEAQALSPGRGGAGGQPTVPSTAADLAARCHGGALEGRWDSVMRFFAQPSLLIIDELGYLPLAGEAASALFQVVARRYLKGSIILTTNRGIPSWGQIFDDPMVAAAMLDRLLHKSVVLQIDGESYRMRAHRARAEALRKGVMHTATTAYHVCPIGLLTWGISVIEPGEFPRSPSTAARPIVGRL
jgi:hypothetical protein